MIFEIIEKITGIERDTKDTGVAGVILYAADNLLWLAVSFYLVMMGIVLPLYLPGYSRLGSEKGLFWIKYIGVSGSLLIAALFFYVLSFLIRLFTDKKKPKNIKNLFPRKMRIYASDVWAGLFCVSVFISYLLSEDRQISLYGEKGWYLGLYSYLALGIGVMVISRLRESRNLFPVVIMVGSVLVSVIGILMDFFGDILHAEGWSQIRVSTLGNPNWFCGYMITVMFTGAAFFILYKSGDSQRDTMIIAAFVLYIIVTSYMIFTQGSASAYPAICVVILTLLAFAGKDAFKVFKVMIIISLMALSNLMHSLYVALGGMLRGNDAVGTLLSKPVFAFGLLFVTSLITTYFGTLVKMGSKTLRVNLGVILGSIFATVTLIYFVLLTVNTVSTSHFLGEGLFYFDSGWGSSRGTTMRAGFDMLKGMTPLELMFGKGPDSFFSFLMSGRFPETAIFIDGYFGGARLTNAHCEPLTMLINAGIAGTVSFYGLLLYVMAGGFKRMKRLEGMRKITAFACSLSILAYIINNIFSFQTSVNVSQLALVLGFGALSVMPDKSENG